MGYDVQICRQCRSALVDLKGNQSAVKKWIDDPALDFPRQPNTAGMAGDIEIYWTGPENWLLRAPIANEPEFLIKTRPQSVPMEISAVLVSDALLFFEISGTDADQIITVASPLDIHPNAFPANGVTYTEAFGLKGLIIRRTGKFELAVELSYADMIEDFLRRVAA